VRLLLDTCVWGGTREVLSGAGLDVVWTGDWERDPGDQEILAIAHREHRVFVTLDKDFGELAVVLGHPHSGIIRLVGFGAREQAVACLRVLELHGEELSKGALVTVRQDRIRIRPAEVG
jgi:predicted nuclease of predicted toxin-antitoxin system